MNSGAFFSAVALIALCVLWMEAWAGYFRDRLRARVLELRDRLAGLAANGRVNAGSPEYRRLAGLLDAAAGGPRWLLTPARLLLCACRCGRTEPPPRPAGDLLAALAQA